MNDEDKIFDEVLEEFTESLEDENIITEPEPEPEPKPKPEQKPEQKPEPVRRREKMVYKITNKTFQPLQIVINENEIMLLGSRKNDNVIYVRQLTNQINNLQKKGLVKIRKMN